MDETFPDPSQKWSPNYQYQITTTVQVEGRLSYIKHLRATLLYMEENVSLFGLNLIHYLSNLILKLFLE